jgi:catechol 2,3-dioxygenase-like lactoylglutathione lyase family enzyme
MMALRDFRGGLEQIRGDGFAGGRGTIPLNVDRALTMEKPQPLSAMQWNPQGGFRRMSTGPKESFRMDHATPNLPSRNFAVTAAFYAALGFEERWRDASWMILTRGDLLLEFFPWPDLDPLTSGFGSCLRLDDLDGFYAVALAAGIAEGTSGFPRLHPATLQHGLRIGALLDPDGSLLRLIQNQ